MRIRAKIAAGWERQDLAALMECARERPEEVLRYLSGRLYSADEREKWRAVEALGRAVEDRAIAPQGRVVELLRRFFWALNDESGSVPFGTPEAVGEILARRPELQSEFLPMLCSILTDEELSQTGAIEQGVVWAVGRVGAPAAACPGVSEALRRIRETHGEIETRQIAAAALAKIDSR